MNNIWISLRIDNVDEFNIIFQEMLNLELNWTYLAGQNENPKNQLQNLFK